MSKIKSQDKKMGKSKLKKVMCPNKTGSSSSKI